MWDCDLIDSLFVVSTNVYGAIALEQQHDECCPIGKLNWLNSVGLAHNLSSLKVTLSWRAYGTGLARKNEDEHSVTHVS